MTSTSAESYLKQLRCELRKRFVPDGPIVEEVRGHLADAVESAHQRGTPLAAAESEAIQRFGTPALVAAAFAAGRTRILHPCLLVAASLAGAVIAYIDSRPTWDDTGLTAGAMLLVAAALGLLGPQRPWLWALAVGLWIPIHAIVRAPALGSVAMLVVLVFPFAGAYLGRGARSLAALALS